MSLTKKKNRIIALVDMDCFYVQVVQRKDPSLKGKPCAVVQYKAWKGGAIIAVGYEARKFGVTRQMRGDDAKQKCPEIVLVHVPESRGKADLTQFREAGAEVIEVLATFTDCLERASIDEAYMDLSNSISRYTEKYTLEEIALRTFQTTHLIGLDNIEVNLTKEEILKCDLFKQWSNTLRNNKDNYNLAVGAVIADDMRKAVREKTGFSCSAGIGHNKALAKVVAGFHKPNQQTLILPENVTEMFQTTEMKKVRSLGGKLGLLLQEKLKVQFMSDLCNFSLNALQSHAGEKNGELVYWLCRGIDHEPVRPRQLPKSVSCSKNFMGKEMLTSKPDVYKWLTNLVEEVWERLEKEKENNSRLATLFTVGCWNENKHNQSKRVSIVKQSLNLLRDEAFRALSDMNKSRSGDLWAPGLTNISFSASKFQTTASSGSASINKYMYSGSDVKSAQKVMETHENTSTVDTKRLLPTKSKENKAIQNYFSMNKQKINEFGRCYPDNNYTGGSVFIDRGGNTVLEEVKCGCKDEKSTNKSSYTSAQQKIQLSPVSITPNDNNQRRNHSNEIELLHEQNDRSESYDDYLLPEDPLDFSYRAISTKMPEKHIKRTTSTNNKLNSLFEEMDNNEIDLHRKNCQETHVNDHIEEHFSQRQTSFSYDTNFSPMPCNLSSKNVLRYKSVDNIHPDRSNTRDQKHGYTGKLYSVETGLSRCGYIDDTEAKEARDAMLISSFSSDPRDNAITGTYTPPSYQSDPGVTSNCSTLLPDVSRTSLRSKEMPKSRSSILKEMSTLYQNYEINTIKTTGISEQSRKEERTLKDGTIAPKVVINCLGDQKRYESEHRSKFDSELMSSKHSPFTKVNAMARPSRNGYFANLKPDNGKIYKSLNTSENNCSTLRDEVNLKQGTSRKGYFASLMKDQDGGGRFNEVESNASNGKENVQANTKENATIASNISVNNSNLSYNDVMCNYASENDVMSCEKCGKRILVWDLPEHIDYHYAKDIEDSMKKEFLSLYKHQSSTISPPKKKSKQNNLMMKYFSPGRKK